MENVRYTVKRLAEIVGATEKQVAAALGRKDGFSPEDLPVLREGLKKRPGPFPVGRMSPRAFPPATWP